MSPKFPCTSEQMQNSIWNLGREPKRKDAPRDISYRRHYRVAPNQKIESAKTKIALYCRKHRREFFANWVALRYAGESCSKQTCPECDVERGAIRRGHGTTGATLSSQLRSRNMRVIRVEKNGEIVAFWKQRAYFADDRVVLRCTKLSCGKRCDHETTQTVSNLKYWLNVDPHHLRCQGEACRSERCSHERETQIKDVLSTDWTCVGFSKEHWTLRHDCGYELHLKWKQFKRFSETVVDRERCAVCTGRIPDPLGRTEGNVRLWLARHVPHVTLVKLNCAGEHFEVVLSCLEHGGNWLIGATDLRLNRSAGCIHCEKKIRSEKPSHWRSSIEVICHHIGLWPQHWPDTPDDRCDWIGTDKHGHASFREILKEVPISVLGIGGSEESSEEPFCAALSHFAIAGWLQADGYDTSRKSPRAAITLLACDLPVLKFIASNVQCLSRLGVRFRSKGKPSGVYLTLTITDEAFLSWIAEQFKFSRTKGESGYPRISMNHDQATAYLSGLLGGDGHVSNKRRGSRIEWLVAKNKALATWIHFELESVVLTALADSAKTEEFISTGKRAFAKRWDNRSRKLSTLAIIRKEACAHIARLLLGTCRAYLPARKIHVLQDIVGGPMH